ncbi:MAG: ATP-binding protein, partial [Bacteroidetes bacterium]
MNRYFNTTGLCNPQDHYMVDPFRGLKEDIYRLIEAKQYFLIHAPRQTGKTTFLHQLAHRINGEGKYICLVFSVESAGVRSFTEEMASERMVDALYSMRKRFLQPEVYPPQPEHPISLKDYVQQWSESQTRPIVLLIDEVDSLWDDVLVSFLRQMRDGFQIRPESFPSSIALVGLRDIREYKTKARSDNPSLGSGSPFNIKAKSFFLPVFSREEVRGLLDQHTHDTGQVFSEEVFERLYVYTSGQPWLTNAIANEIVAERLKNDYSQPITPDMVEKAKEALIAQRQTHLDSLVDKLKEPRVRQIVLSIINGESPIFDDYNDAIRYCRDLGIVTQKSPVQFANPIYREIITRIINHSLHDGFDQDTVQTAWYLNPDGSLDIDKL